MSQPPWTPPDMPPNPPRRRAPTWAIAAVAAAGVVGLGCVAGVAALVIRTGSPATSPTPAFARPSPSATGHTIRFEVTSSQDKVRTINWSTVEDYALIKDVATPWTHTAFLEARSGPVGINVLADDGTVGCKLFIDGELADEGESEEVINCYKLIMIYRK